MLPLDGKARSQRQQRFMAICEHNPQHARGACPKMTKTQYHDYSSTPRKGLPDRAPKKTSS
jgi:hypothetical protein